LQRKAARKVANAPRREEERRIAAAELVRDMAAARLALGGRTSVPSLQTLAALALARALPRSAVEYRHVATLVEEVVAQSLCSCGCKREACIRVDLDAHEEWVCGHCGAADPMWLKPRFAGGLALASHGCWYGMRFDAAGAGSFGDMHTETNCCGRNIAYDVACTAVAALGGHVVGAYEARRTPCSYKLGQDAWCSWVPPP
jgi:hypothetical protein